jgi:hypothetical protein
MGFKMINNSTLSAAVSLLFVVLLTQSRFFNFLLDTAWGRFVLITFIIIISYLNKILGVVSVLFVIIMFNQSDIAVFEGFTTDASGNMKNKVVDDKMKSTVSDNNNNNDMKNKISESSNKNNGPNKPNQNPPTNVPNVVKKEKVTAQEGFDMIGTENNIKRGKQSNSINVNGFTNNSNDVSAYEGFNSTSDYSAF